MTSTLPRPAFVSFSSRSGLGISMPPGLPPTKPTFGGYCMRATCGILPADAPEGACPIARVSGYDKHPGVAKDTEFVCRAHTRTMGGTMGGQYRCTPAEVVLLPNSDMECSGQMWFTMDGQTKRLV